MSETETETKTDIDTRTNLEAFGLTNIAASQLERVLVRQRESPVTTSAWRLEVTSDQADYEDFVLRVDRQGFTIIQDGIAEHPFPAQFDAQFIENMLVFLFV